MKKIIAVLLMLVLISTASYNVLSVDTNQKIKQSTNIMDNIDLNHSSEKTDKGSCKCDFVDGYAVMSELPPKSEEMLNMMIKNPQPSIDTSLLPAQFSWTDFDGGDWTSPAKNQQNCGSCWAFAALGAMEAAINIASGRPFTDIDLSEQYVLACLSSAGSCSGGWMSSTLQYIKSTNSGSTGNGINGCTIESCMNYQAVDYIPCSDKCPNWDEYTDPPQADNKLFQIKDFEVTSTNPDNPADWDLMKSWVYTHGPISVDMYVSNGFRNFWGDNTNPNAVYDGSEEYITNHGVLLCGWKDDPYVTNGGYWIIKNSWGTNWGYNGGFCNIAYGCLQVGDRDVCWVETTEWPYDPPEPEDPEFVYADFYTNPSYPVTGAETKFLDNTLGNVSLYQWDFDGDGIFDVSGTNENNPSWTFTSEGVYEVTLSVWSTTDLHNEITKTIEIKDSWSPIPIASPEYYGGKNNEVSFDALDSWDPDGTIASYAWDFDGDGNIDSDRVSATFTYPNQNGEYTTRLTVTDDDGNTDSCEVLVKIDITEPPVTEAFIGGIAQDENQWFNGDVRVDLKSSDWTGVETIFYKINNGEWNTISCNGEKEYTYAELTIAGKHGIHILEYYAEDIYGNVEDMKSSQIKIDMIDPEATISFDGEQYNEWYITPVDIQLSGSDGESGLASLRYRIGLSWHEFVDTVTIPNDVGGGVTVEYQAEDNAGNIYYNMALIYMDMPPSAPKITGPGSGVPGEEYSFYFVSTDADQGGKISYFIDWGDGTDTGWTEYVESGESIIKSHTWDTKEECVITAKAKDEFGAVSEESTSSIVLPKNKAMLITSIIYRILEQHPLLYQIFF